MLVNASSSSSMLSIVVRPNLDKGCDLAIHNGGDYHSLAPVAPDCRERVCRQVEVSRLPTPPGTEQHPSYSGRLGEEARGPGPWRPRSKAADRGRETPWNCLAVPQASSREGAPTKSREDLSSRLRLASRASAHRRAMTISGSHPVVVRATLRRLRPTPCQANIWPSTSATEISGLRCWMPSASPSSMQ